jgi:hypothetical protein
MRVRQFTPGGGPGAAERAAAETTEGRPYFPSTEKASSRLLAPALPP